MDFLGDGSEPDPQPDPDEGEWYEPADEPPPGIPFLAVIAIVLSMVMLAEIGVRLMGDHVPPVELGDAEEIVVKVEQMDARRAAGQPTDVVFVGASTMDAGVDPAAFDAASTRTASAYNASIQGLPLKFMPGWIDDHVIPRLQPGVVVVGVQPTQLAVPSADFGRSVEIFDAAYQRSLARVDPDSASSVQAYLEDRSALVGARGQLRRPSILARALFDTAIAADPPVPEFPEVDWTANVGPTGQNLRFGVAPPEPAPDPAMTEVLNSALDGGYRLAEVEAIIATLQDDDVDLVIVVPPLDTVTFAASGLDLAPYRDAIAALVELAADHDVPVLNYFERGYAPTEYHDKLHLATAGAARFSADLAAGIDQLCADGTLRRCPTP